MEEGPLHLAVEPLLEVQVRTGRAAAGADQADHVALVDPLARDRPELVEVGVERGVPAAVVDHDVPAVAAPAQVGDGGDDARRRGERGLAEVGVAVEVRGVGARAVVRAGAAGPLLAARERHLVVGNRYGVRGRGDGEPGRGREEQDAAPS